MTVTFNCVDAAPAGATDAGFAHGLDTTGASLSTAVRLRICGRAYSPHVAFWSAVAPHTLKVISAPSSDSFPLTGSCAYLPAVPVVTFPLSSPPMYALITVPIDAFTSLSVTFPENLFGGAVPTADAVPNSTKNIERTIDVVINNFVLVLLLLLIPSFVLILLFQTVSLLITYPSFHVITYIVSVCLTSIVSCLVHLLLSRKIYDYSHNSQSNNYKHNPWKSVPGFFIGFCTGFVCRCRCCCR